MRWTISILAVLIAASGVVAQKESRVTLGCVVEGERVTIQVVDGKPTVKFEGGVSAKGRYEVKADHIILKGADGRPRATVRYKKSSGSIELHERKAPRVRLGITAGKPGESLTAHLGLDGGKVMILETVKPGSPAAKAGLKRHDIVTLIEGESPATLHVLKGKLQKKKPGEQIKLRVLRKGRPYNFVVTLGEDKDTITHIRGNRVVLGSTAVNTVDGTELYVWPKIEYGKGKAGGPIYVGKGGRYAIVGGYSTVTSEKAGGGAKTQSTSIIRKELKAIRKQLQRIEAQLKKLLKDRKV